jgi:hypothetical protein
VEFRAQNAVSFTVIDSPDGDSARGDYGRTLRGGVRPLLKWETTYSASDSPADRFPAADQIGSNARNGRRPSCHRDERDRTCRYQIRKPLGFGSQHPISPTDMKQFHDDLTTPFPMATHPATGSGDRAADQD